jgi:uncharacterized protein (TIRG00374 family)
MRQNGPSTNPGDLSTALADASPKTHRRRLWSYILLSFVGVAAVVVLLLRVDRDAIADELGSADLLWVLAGAAALGAFYIGRAARWYLILGKRHPFSFLFWTSSVGYLANNAAPGLGELVKPWLLRNRRGVPFAEGVSTVMLERLLDFWGLATIGLASLAVLGVEGTSVAGWLWAVGMAVAAAATVALVATFLLAGERDRVSSWCAWLLDRLPIQARLGERVIAAIDSLLAGAAVLRSDLPTRVVLFTGTLVIWLINALAAYCAFRAVGLEPGAAVLTGGLMIVAVSQGLPAPPGYIGTYQAVWLVAYSALGLEPEAKVLAAAVVSHGLILIVTTFFGFVGLQAIVISPRELLTLRKQPRSALVPAGVPSKEGL